MPEKQRRVLGVACNDFGELALAMYFLQGSLADRATLLLPPRLADRDDGRLPLAVRRFSSGEDILRAVDEEQPAAVLLFSGYLLTLHGILRREEFPELVRQLSARCRVLTSDPFLGLVSDGDLTNTFDIQVPSKWAFARLIGLVVRRKLVRHLSTARRALEQVPHLYPFPYPFPPPDPGDRHRATRPERISFYNPELIRADREGDGKRLGSVPPVWLFILSKEDWSLQGMRHGHKRFAALVARKLEETVDADRTPVLVGPEPFLERLRTRIMRSDRIRLLSFLPYTSFDALTRSAEYVFYWNIVSASSWLRVLHDGPFFTFHEGHLAGNVKGLRERVRASYYRGWEPVVLDQTKPLDRDRLSALAADFGEASSRIRTALAAAPTPDALMESLLGGR